MENQYSHIHSLGIDNENNPVVGKHHLIGQEKAREALGVLKDMVIANKFSGKMVVINGPTGCGKTSAAIAFSKELGHKIPHKFLSASEIQGYKSEFIESVVTASSENLMPEIQNNKDDMSKVTHSLKSMIECVESGLRRSIIVKIKEIKNIYEGEVTEINSRAVTLKSRKNSITLNIDNLDVKLGDLIYIENKVVKKIATYNKGEVYRKKEKVHHLSLDEVNLMSLRNREYEIHYGVLFIDDTQVLNRSVLTYLYKRSEEEMCPLIVLITNKMMEDPQILSKSLVIQMNQLNREEIKNVIQVKANEYIVKAEKTKNNSKDVLFTVADSTDIEMIVEKLVDLSIKYGIRYSLNLVKVLSVMDCKDVDAAVRMFPPLM